MPAAAAVLAAVTGVCAAGVASAPGAAPGGGRAGLQTQPTLFAMITTELIWSPMSLQ